jgi:hypothetical protein
MTAQDDGRLLTWPQWPRVDNRGLARFVTLQASRWLPLPISRFDVGSHLDQRRIIARAIYDALTARDIRYALEEYHPSQALQTIRTPSEILIAPREGTCLDLAALYCGLCLANELLPILIIIDGHALAAVSLTHGVRDWDHYRPGGELFATGPLTDAQKLRDLIDEESFLAVECTGFAHSDQLGQKIADMPEAQHRVGGVLTFEQAAVSGRLQLDQVDRPFQFAIDIAMAHYGWRIEPYSLEAPAGDPATPPSGEAELSEDITELKQAVEKAGPPPELHPGENIEEWITALAAWNDDTTALVDDIELAVALTSRDPSARFVQQRDKARESVQAIISGLRSPRTPEHAAGLSETAATLRGQVARLARLAMEP